ATTGDAAPGFARARPEMCDERRRQRTSGSSHQLTRLRRAAGTIGLMPRLIEGPTRVEAAGTPPKTIREHIGVVNTGESRVSVAHMTSPPGWAEPWQQPDFDEWTVVLAGAVLVEHDGGSFVAAAGQAVH